MYRMALK